MSFYHCSDPGELTKHVQNNHHDHKFHLCSYCFFKAPTKSILLRHIKKVSPDWLLSLNLSQI